ncbi:hypothetical protein GWK47_051077 [Chionoecetes opilio]|uniref:Uncharacterized protein n=1 Tax=Chionoecetes opilio TaxID=41210 RepID=A0A8J4Y140_CHIOP|nr:hypothetical protein GWK47_051077 [Chionoecetes opilio]
MVVQKLPAGDELWVAFGTGKNYRYIAAHEIASSLGPEKTCALFPKFHAITGCDTVSAFVGHGKKSAWATWNTLPELTDALLSLANAPTSIQEDTMHVIERFVILLYDRTSKCKDVNKARKKLFAKKSSVQEHPANLRCSGAACEEICPSGWSCLGPGIGTRARAPSTNRLGLASE